MISDVLQSLFMFEWQATCRSSVSHTKRKYTLSYVLRHLFPRGMLGI